MAYMTNSEAKETIETLRDRAAQDCLNLQKRIVDLGEDYEKDPGDDTAAQLNRLEDRLVIRRLESEALSIAVMMFEKEEVQ